MYRCKLIFPLLLILTIGMGAACRQSQTVSDAYNIKLTSPLFPPLVGEDELVFQVTDDQGTAVSGLTLEVKGDMTHAGMVPVLREVTTDENGQYTVPWEWTMGGDWVVSVSAMSNNGTSQNTLAQTRFDLLVDGEVPICGPDGKPINANQENEESPAEGS